MAGRREVLVGTVALLVAILATEAVAADANPAVATIRSFLANIKTDKTETLANGGMPNDEIGDVRNALGDAIMSMKDDATRQNEQLCDLETVGLFSEVLNRHVFEQSDQIHNILQEQIKFCWSKHIERVVARIGLSYGKLPPNGIELIESIAQTVDVQVKGGKLNAAKAKKRHDGTIRIYGNENEDDKNGAEKDLREMTRQLRQISFDESGERKVALALNKLVNERLGGAEMIIKLDRQTQLATLRAFFRYELLGSCGQIIDRMMLATLNKASTGGTVYEVYSREVVGESLGAALRHAKEANEELDHQLAVYRFCKMFDRVAESIYTKLVAMR